MLERANKPEDSAESEAGPQLCRLRNDRGDCWVRGLDRGNEIELVGGGAPPDLRAECRPRRGCHRDPRRSEGVAESHACQNQVIPERFRHAD